MKTFYLPACALLLLGCNEPGKQDSNSTTPTEDPSPAAEEQDPNTISFTKVKRAPGDVRHQTERLTMNMTFMSRLIHMNMVMMTEDLSQEETKREFTGVSGCT